MGMALNSHICVMWTTPNTQCMMIDIKADWRKNHLITPWWWPMSLLTDERSMHGAGPPIGRNLVLKLLVAVVQILSPTSVACPWSLWGESSDLSSSFIPIITTLLIIVITVIIYYNYNITTPLSPYCLCSPGKCEQCERQTERQQNPVPIWCHGWSRTESLRRSPWRH